MRDARIPVRAMIHFQRIAKFWHFLFIASSKWLDSFGHIYPVVFEWRTRIWRAAQQGIYSHAHHPVGSFYWKLRRLLDIGNAEQLILFFGFDALTLSFKVFHKMLVDGHERLESLYECLLTILANISPYIKSLSMITRYFSHLLMRYPHSVLTCLNYFCYI